MTEPSEFAKKFMTVDTSPEACAVICMLVSNPQGAFRKDGDGWQKRVNDLIRALQDERDALLARTRHLDIKRSTESGTKDVWLHFEGSDGKHTAISVSAIAFHLLKGGHGPNALSRALNQWIIDRHGEP